MDILSLIIGMKLGGGSSSLPVIDANGECNFDELGLTWDTSAEVNE